MTEESVYVDEELTKEDVEEMTVQGLLEYLSLDVLRTNALKQITGEIETTRDLLEDAYDRYNFFRTNKTDPSEIKELDDEFIDNFCMPIIDAISKQFNLGIDHTIEESLACIDMADTLYTFFILNREEFTTQYLISYIKTHGTDIINVMGLGGNTDVSAQAYKKSGIDKDAVTLIANVNSVIDFIIAENGLDPMEFLNSMVDEMECVDSMKEYYQTYQVMGQFVQEYLDILNDHGTERSLRIRNNVRVLLITYHIAMKHTSSMKYEFDN